MLCDWEGNRRSGVAPALRHRLRGLSTYGLNGHWVGDEHLAYAFGARHLYLLPFTAGGQKRTFGAFGFYL